MLKPFGLLFLGSFDPVPGMGRGRKPGTTEMSVCTRQRGEEAEGEQEGRQRMPAHPPGLPRAAGI